jgi:hypothetical protein
MRTIRMLAVVLVVSALSILGHGQSSAAGAPVPNLVNFVGTLKDSIGHPIQSVTGVTFALYGQEEGGVPLWLETQTVRADGKGNYTVQLGATKAGGLPLDLFSSSTARWLGVRINGGEEQPRVLLVSVPYALKAADSQTLGGLPASAFMLAASFNAGNNATAASTEVQSPSVPPPPAAITGTGTANFLPRFTAATTVGNSALFQTGASPTAKIGINNSAPIAALDVTGGANISGQLSLPSNGIASAAAGKRSWPLNIRASAFNSGSKAAVQQNFQWVAEPTGNNTAAPGGTLNLLYAQGATTPVETGFRVTRSGIVSFASGQTFPGAGTITGVTAGTALTGGGTAGSVTLSVDSTKVPLLSVSNSFADTQFVFSTADTGFVGDSTNSYGVLGESDSSYGVYGFSGGSDGVHGISNTGTAVYGQSTSGYGVYGSSPGNYAVVGVTNSGNGVYGQVAVAPQAGVIGRQSDASGNWGVYAFGNIGATGTKSSVVPVDNGARQVALYAVESPGVWFEDYGSGKLVSGVATVKIDPTYAQTVNTGVEYHVFLTPDGDCDGLYVTARTATSFEVRELHQGRSNVAFDYRIIAVRRGYETKRLADVTYATPRSAIEPLRLGQAGSAVGTAVAK